MSQGEGESQWMWRGRIGEGRGDNEIGFLGHFVPGHFGEGHREGSSLEP